MADLEKTPEEILSEEKESLFNADIEKSKAQQLNIIGLANSEIAYADGQIAKNKQVKEIAQKLLDELEARYPTPEELHND